MEAVYIKYYFKKNGGGRAEKFGHEQKLKNRVADDSSFSLTGNSLTQRDKVRG